MKNQKRILFLALLIGMYSVQIIAQSESIYDLSPTKDSKSIFNDSISGPTDDDLCIPVYTSGCSGGAGIYSFAVEEIQNIGSLCADNTGYPGWSEYYDLGPAILFPGMTHIFSIAIINYWNDDFWVDIWIDYNDDLILTDDELILDDFHISQPSALQNVNITIPLDALPGLHVMRVRTRWNNKVYDPCTSYSTGEAEDYNISIGTSNFGTLEGFVSEFTGGTPVENALISVNYGMHTTISGSDGYYSIDSVFLGDWNVSCTHENYNPAIDTTVTITTYSTTQQNFSLTAPTLEIDTLAVTVNLDPSTTTMEYVTIFNNGDGPLNWSAVIINNNGDEFLETGSKAFAYNSSMTGPDPEGPMFFSLDDPSNITTFGSPVPGTIVTAEWANEKWYGIISSGYLVTIDTATGEFSTIGPSPDLVGMAMDWTQATMYGVDFTGNLYTINLETGSGTIVATTNENIKALVCDNNGTLYGFYGNWNTFGKINKNTGQFSYIGSIGFNISGVQDASLDRETNTIYWAFFNAAVGRNLYTVDATNGSPTLIGSFPNNVTVSAMAIPGIPSGWISINTVSGNLSAGDDFQFAIDLNAMDYIPGDTLEADIHFTSVPDVGEQDVHVKMIIGTEQWGNIQGTVLLDGLEPYNNGGVTEVEIVAGPYTCSPDTSGNYSFAIYPGTYDLTASLYGYETQTIEGITITPGGQVDSVDFILPCINGMISGIVTNTNGGVPIEGAIVEVLDSELFATTISNGSYELIIESGNYGLEASAPDYMPQTAYGVIVTAESTITQNFQLDESEGTIVVFDLDPTPNPEIVNIIEYIKPGYLVEYVTDSIAYPLNDQVYAVFLLLGIYPNNHMLTEGEATVITSWLDTYGGNLYMEGGDTWAFDPPTTLHSYFNIIGISDGSDDLYDVNGINGPWANYSWSYIGENYWIDHIVAVPPAINVLENPIYGYYTGVAYASGNYKTVGTSHEVTGLNYGYFWDAISCIFSFFDSWQPSFGSLEGYVIETDTGDPVEGALVSVGTQGSDDTDTTGYYFIEYIPSGSYTASCSKEGYSYVSTPVTILQDDTTSLNFQLEAPGSLEGIVSDIVSGVPIANATVDVGNGSYTATTGSEGTYFFNEILAGEWIVHCEAVDYNSVTDTVIILSNQISELNFELGGPDFIVEPSYLEISMNLNETLDTFLLLSNPGYVSVNWTADLLFPEGNCTDDLFDLQFTWPNAVGGGEAGIETNGDYIYTTKWNGDGHFYRYDMDGNYLGEFTIPIVYGLRDLAYDGTYFFGGTGQTTVYEMDLDNEIVISQFTAPTEIRAIAYNEVEDIFYANNWDTDITAFDYTGQYLGSFPIGPFGSSYYGFAFDDYSPGSPFLWGYAQEGGSSDDENWLVQIALPSGEETGITFNVETVVSPISGIAGGLCISDELINNSYTIMGEMQNEYIWGLKLIPFSNWISIEQWSGTLLAGDSTLFAVHLSSNEILPGLHTADIQFKTDPDVENSVVNVSLLVENNSLPPTNLVGYFECTDIWLSWEIPPGSFPNYFNIYRNGLLHDTTPTAFYCDTMLIPEVDYIYYITAVYYGEESIPTPEFIITVPIPIDLEPVNLEGIPDLPDEFDVTLIWEQPEGCLIPYGYNIYHNDNQFNASLVMDTTYIAQYSPGFNEYYVIAVYYFGESTPSNSAYVLYPGVVDQNSINLNIFPNPSSKKIIACSETNIFSVQILEQSGKMILSKECNTNRVVIDVSDMNPGVYIIRIESGDETIFRKIIIQ